MPSSSPQWLTPIITLPEFEGDLEKYLEHLFSIFKKDFIDSNPTFRGEKIFFDNRDDGGRPAAFVHVTTETDRVTNERQLCLRRCERVGWVRLIIENHNDPAVLVWEREHQGKSGKANRIYLFLECEDFLIILEEKKKGHFIITAILVDNKNQKRKHLKAYQDFKKLNL